jgi:hypothetical protein
MDCHHFEQWNLPANNIQTRISAYIFKSIDLNLHGGWSRVGTGDRRESARFPEDWTHARGGENHKIELKILK